VGISRKSRSTIAARVSPFVEQQHRRPQRQVDALRPVMRARPQLMCAMPTGGVMSARPVAGHELLVHRCSSW